MGTEEFIDIEEALQRLSLPDDIPEFTQNFPGPDLEASERIKRRTMQLVQSELMSCKPKSRRNQSKAWYITIVSAAAILLVVLLVGPNKVGAAVNSLLTYIPGFGIHSTEDVNLAAPNSVRAERNGVKIDINGVFADNKGTSVMAYVAGEIPDFNSSYLVDSTGKRYSYQGGSMGESQGSDGTIQNYWAWYTVLPADVKQVALVIPSLSNWAINIPLVPAVSMNAAEKFGPADTKNNVTVSGQATKFADETKITLLVQSLRGGVFESVEKPLLSSVDGKSYPLNNQSATFVGSGLAYFSTGPDISERLTVTIPSLFLQDEVHGSMVIPLPQNDLPLTLNKSVNLGAWTLQLKKAEVVNQDNEKSLKVYVESNFLNGAVIDRLGNLSVNGAMDSWSSEYDPSTGGIKWFQIPFPNSGKNAKIEVGQINVLVHGPWKINLPVESGFK